nr:MAG TPA: hypothetical protein [Bacteriophage sp.]
MLALSPNILVSFSVNLSLSRFLICSTILFLGRLSNRVFVSFLNVERSNLSQSTLKLLLK